MSGSSLSGARDVTLSDQMQTELRNVTLANTEAMNEQQLMGHIRAIKTGLTAYAQLPTTSRLSDLQKERQSVRDAEAQISDLLEEGKKIVTERDNMKQTLVLGEQKIARIEAKAPECSYGDLVDKVRYLE